MTTEHDQGDYVLVHKSKAKISRARKMIIGVMAIGAVAAMTGAGTFASFSATTTNDATFKTGRLALSNTIQNGTACFSSGTGVNGTEGDGNLNNNETDCAVLFASVLRPGDTATAGIQVTNANTSNIDGILSLYTNSTCTNANNTADNAGTGNLCNAAEIAIQEYNGGFVTPGTCVYPGPGDCSFASVGDNGKFSDFITAYPFGSRLSLDTTMTVNESHYYVVSVHLDDDGFLATGVGADNIYQNKKASLALTWGLTETP